MIRGVNKNAVIVKGGNGIFEEAIFIIKPCEKDRTITRAELKKEIAEFIKQNTSRK